MLDFLIDLVNHRFFITFSVAAVTITAIVLGQNGIQVIDIAIVLAVAAVCYGLWRLLLTRSTRGVDSLQKYQEALRNNQRPTLVQFYSRYCAGCMAIKPIVDQLEEETGARLQVIRLNIDQEPGKTLMSQYGVIFTPTFIFFDKAGAKLHDSLFVLDRARILRDLDEA